MAIIDGALGFVPMYTPLESQTESFIVSSGQTVYPGQAVTLSSGELVAATAGAAGPIMGVCLDYAVGVADNSVEASVCIARDMQYRILSDAAYDAAEIGWCAPLASNAGSTITRKATSVLDGSALVAHASITASTYVTQVAPYNVVTDEAHQWIVVRLNNLTLSQAFPAT